MLKTKALNRTITTVLILLITVSILSVINIIPLVYATNITYMNPTSGPVGTTVTLQGQLDTYAGAYKIYFDSDNDSVRDAGEIVKTGWATGTSVDTTFTVPNSLNGSIKVWLYDVSANNTGLGNFIVGTTYGIAVTPTVGQEDYTEFTITANVTGGTDTDIPIQINVTKPDGSSYLANVTLVTDTVGYGTKTISSQTPITFDQLSTDLNATSNFPLLNFTYAPVVDCSETIWGNTTLNHGTNVTLTRGLESLPAGANYTCTYNATHGFRGIKVNATSVANATGAYIWANYTYLNFTTPYCGTYTVGMNVSSVTDTFDIILTNATTYNRGDTVGLRSTHWDFTEQKLNSTITDPGGTAANTTLIWVNASAPYRTAAYTWTIPAGATLGTYTVTVTNLTGSGKAAADQSTFTVTGVGVVQFTNVTYPLTSYQRTQTATWKFNVTYPDGSNFTSANATVNPVNVYCNGSLIASATVNYESGADWNATWVISKDQTLGIGYCFNITANSWNDTLGNQGPVATWTSRNFTISLATLTVTWNNSTMAHYNASLTPDSWQNVTLWQNCTFRVTYPDNTVLTNSLASVLNVTVWNSTHTIANLTKAAGNVTYNSGTGNWTVKWYIPYNIHNATDLSRYTFCLLANYTEDTYGNKGPATSTNSTEFKVTPAVITVLSISTTQSSYARETYVTAYFTATYPDGSAVTTGNATIILTEADDTTTHTIYATYSSRFEATYYLETTAQLGTWTATLGVNALNDTKGETPRWYPGNLGPTIAVNTTFTVTESSLLAQINQTVNDIEAKLDHSTYGLQAIKSAIDTVQNALNQIGPKVDSILAIVSNIEDKLILAPSEVKFDFGTQTSLWETGFIQVTPTTAYNSTLGYGWTNTTGLHAIDRGSPDCERRDLIYSSENRTFKVDLLDGNYTVMVTMGDNGYSYHDNMTVTVEGSTATVNAAAKTWVQKVFVVSVTDGSLEVTLKDLGGVDANWVLNSLIIQRSWNK